MTSVDSRSNFATQNIDSGVLRLSVLYSLWTSRIRSGVQFFALVAVAGECSGYPLAIHGEIGSDSRIVKEVPKAE